MGGLHRPGRLLPGQHRVLRVLHGVFGDLRRLLPVVLSVASSPLSHRRWLYPIAIAASAIYAWFIVRASFVVEGHRAFSLFDDAMISMRYARHLAHGEGLVWNVGAPRVEGYSNLLWTLWMALLQVLPLSQRSVAAWVSLTSAGLLIGNLWLVRGLVEGIGGRAPSALFAVLFCAVSYPLVFWSLRGVEVGLLAFLIDASILLAWRAHDVRHRRGRWLLALALAAMVLVRDDALVPASVVLAFLAVDSRTRTVALGCALAVAGTLLGHTLFRVGYYGAPLPNTYYLKIARIDVVERLTRGFVVALRSSVAELVLPLALAAFAAVADPRSRRRWLLFGIVVGQLGYTVWVGGDAWASFGQPDRFVSVALPALSAGAVLGAETLWSGEPSKGYVVAFAAALAWRALAAASGDFIPSSFVVTPPIDLRGGFRGLGTPSGCLLVGAILGGLVLLLARRPWRGAWRPVALGLVVIVATVGANWSDVLHEGSTARLIDWDSHTADFGIRLGEVLPATTTIAVVAAGAIPFFSNLPAVDLLGKSDAHIAREQPLERFVPGHDKRDYAYSLSTYQPDIVVELWHHAPEELRAIEDLGYRKLPNGMYVKRDCPEELVEAILHRLPAYPYRARRPN